MASPLEDFQHSGGKCNHLRIGSQVLAALLSGVLLGLSQPFVIEALGETPIGHPMFPRLLALLAAAGISYLLAAGKRGTGLLLVVLAVCVYDVGLLAFVGYVPLLLVCHRKTPRRCFALGTIAAVTQFVLLAYWVVVAMHTIAGISMLVSTALLLLLAFVMAVHTGTALAVTAMLHRAFHWPLWLVFAPVLCCLEFLRNWFLFDGFPWGNVGYSLASLPVPLQSASVVGVYGLVFYVALVNACLFGWLTAATRKGGRWPVVWLVCVNLLVLGWGWHRLQTPIPQQQTVRVALLQGNIEQHIKNRARHHSRDILRKYLTLEQRAVQQGAQLVVWPESALPGIYRHDITSFSFLPRINAARVMGIVLRDNDSYYNAALSVDAQGHVTGYTKKAHLVPFGEYVPWPLDGVARKITAGTGSFAQADRFLPLPVQLPSSLSLSLGAAICFDGVFPQVSRHFVRSGARLLVNITNDAWYGVSSAAFQHLNMYVLRSVELGRSTVRAANTGISAWVDARGRVHQATALYQDAVVVADVPVLSAMTPYAYVGDILPVLCSLFTWIAGVLACVGTDFWRRQHSVTAWLLGLAGFTTALWVVLSFCLYWQQLSEAQHTARFWVAVLGLFVGCRAFNKKPIEPAKCNKK